MTTSDEWMGFCEQTVDVLSEPSFDANVVSNTASPDISLQYSGSNQSSSPQQSGSSSSRPIRRKPRAFKKTPTTLVNANPTTFRALVQQFTGCPNTLGNRRSRPINLNFAHGGAGNQTGVATSVMSASGNDYNYYQQQQLRQLEQASRQQHQQFYQEQYPQQHAVLFDNVRHDAFTTSRGNADGQIIEAFGLDNMPYSTENANDRNYFF